MDVIMEFATPIGMFYTKEKKITDELYNSVLKISKDDSEDIFKYHDQSKTTPDNLHTRENFKELVNFIESKVERFSKEILGINNKDIELSSMWSNIHNSGSSHNIHQHPNSFLSGVYYPYVPQCEDPGNIIFVDPRQAKNMIYADFVKASCISNRNIWVTPETGLLLLFPSWLEHGTGAFVSSKNEQRVAISFNYQLRSCSLKTMRIEKNEQRTSN